MKMIIKHANNIQIWKFEKCVFEWCYLFVNDTLEMGFKNNFGDNFQKCANNMKKTSKSRCKWLITHHIRVFWVL